MLRIDLHKMEQTTSGSTLGKQIPFDLTAWHRIRRRRLFDVTDTQLLSWGFAKEKINFGMQQCGSFINCQDETTDKKITLALDNMVNIMGHVTYQFGVNNLEQENYATAVFHFQLGTSHKHGASAFNLGICYEQGIGVKKDYHMAMECFYLASNLGHAGAMFNLGVYYARGLGGLCRNQSMAKMCFIAAAVLNQEEALAALEPRYPQIVKQLRDSLVVDYSKTVAVIQVFFEILLKALSGFTTACVSVIYYYDKRYKQRWPKRHKVYCIVQKQHKCIFQPKKQSGGLKYRVKSQLLLGQ